MIRAHNNSIDKSSKYAYSDKDRKSKSLGDVLGLLACVDIPK